MDIEFGMVTILFMISACLGDTAIDCGMNEKLENDKCIPCPECPVGTGLSQPCGFGSGGYLECEPCPDGFYNNDPAGNVCIQCTDCSIYNRRYRYECRAVIDAECGDCLDGYYDNSKNLAHRDELYSCKRCEGGHCNSLTTPTLGVPDGAAVDKAVSLWKPVVGVVVSLFIFFIVCCLIFAFKDRIPQISQSCNRLAETCPCFCLKRSGPFFRRRSPQTADEENLCAISGAGVSGDGFIKVAADGRHADATAGDEEDQRTEPAESETHPSTNGARTDDVPPAQSGPSGVHLNTDDGIQKSIVLKTKVMPGSRSQQTGNDTFGDMAVVGCSHPTEEPPIQYNVPVQVNAFEEESRSGENPVEATSVLYPEPDSQDVLDELRTPYERSGFSDDGFGEASTLLIRGQERMADSEASDNRRSSVPHLRRLGSWLSEIVEENSAEAAIELTATTNSESHPIGRCVGTSASSSAATTSVKDSAGKQYSSNRHPRNRQSLPLASLDEVNGSTEGHNPSGTSPPHDRPCSGTTSIVKASGSPSHMVVNNGGISIQVFNYLPQDLEKQERAVDTAVVTPAAVRVDPEDASPTSSLPSYDRDQTQVKRVFRRDYFPLGGPSRRCTPKDEQSFPSVTHFPVQETCDGPPCSLSVFQ